MARGNILERAIRDAKRFVTKGGFENEITFYINSEEFIVKGLTPKHHVLFDT